MKSKQPKQPRRQMTPPELNAIFVKEVRQSFGPHAEMLLMVGRLLQSLGSRPSATTPEKSGEKS